MSGNKPSKMLNYIIGFSLAALLLWLFLKDVDWTKIGESFYRVNLWLLGGALAAHILSTVLRSERWRLMVQPIKPDVPLHSCWKFFNIGFTATALLPGRVGEVLRPYLLAREQGIRFTSVLATVVTERVIDLLMVLAMLGTIFAFPDVLGSHPDPSVVATLKLFGLVALLAATAGFLFLLLVRFRTAWALAMVRFLTRPFPEKLSEKLAQLAGAFADGLGALHGVARVSLLVVETVAAWGMIAAFYWLSLLAFGIAEPWYYTFFLLAVVALGVVVPTPAGAGTFHIAAVLVVNSLWGHDYNTAASFAILSHLLAFGSLAMFGIYYLLKGEFSLFKVAERAGEVAEAEEG